MDPQRSTRSNDEEGKYNDDSLNLDENSSEGFRAVKGIRRTTNLDPGSVCYFLSQSDVKY